MKYAKSWVAGSSFRFGYRAVEALVNTHNWLAKMLGEYWEITQIWQPGWFLWQLTFIKDPPCPQHYGVTRLQPLLLIYPVNAFSAYGFMYYTCPWVQRWTWAANSPAASRNPFSAMAQPTTLRTKVQREKPALQKWVPALWVVVVQTGISDLQSTEMHYLCNDFHDKN